MSICFECDNKLEYPIEKFSGFCSMCHKPKTSRERQATFKERMKKQGHVRVESWIPASKKPELIEFVESLKTRPDST